MPSLACRPLTFYLLGVGQPPGCHVDDGGPQPLKVITQHPYARIALSAQQTSLTTRQVIVVGDEFHTLLHAADGAGTALCVEQHHETVLTTVEPVGNPEPVAR